MPSLFKVSSLSSATRDLHWTWQQEPGICLGTEDSLENHPTGLEMLMHHHSYSRITGIRIESQFCIISISVEPYSEAYIKH